MGWLWFLVMLVPTIGLVQAHVQALADRFVYMPIIADMLNEGQQFGEAIHYYREALRLGPDFLPVLNNLALLLATCEQPRFRNGPEAVQLAERAAQLTDRRDANVLGTLAAAYGQAGRFAEAVKTTQEAQSVAKASGADYLLSIQAEMLAKFRAAKPFR